MDKFSKKAMSEKTLLYLLIAAVVLLILLFFVMKVYDYMTSKGDVESCRLSILAAAEARLAGRTTVTMHCPRKSLVLSKESYTVDGDKKKYSSKDYATNVKQIFAQEMVECWSKTGEGEANTFEEALVGNTNACLICSHIQFQETPDEDIGSLSDYLKKTNIPVSVATQLEDVTYYDYINRDFQQKAFAENSFFVSILQALGIDYGTKTLHSNILLDDQGEIDPTKQYYILLLGIKRGAFEIYEQDTYFMVVGKTETLTPEKTRFCDYLYN